MFWGRDDDGKLIPLRKMMLKNEHWVVAKGPIGGPEQNRNPQPNVESYQGHPTWYAWECETCGIYADNRPVLSHMDDSLV